MTVINEIIARRQHQAQKGYHAAHDDEHSDGSILKAAAGYLGRSQGWDSDGLPRYPWGQIPPGSCRNDLIDAAALIVAEIERLDRAMLGARELEGPHLCSEAECPYNGQPSGPSCRCHAAVPR